MIGLVQNFYVRSPLGDLNPLSSLSIKNPTSIFNWPDNWQHRENTIKIYPAGGQSGSYEDAFEMMVRRCGRCVPSGLFLPFSGGNRAEIPQKKIDRQADRFDGDLGHKKHKNRLSERPQICRQKNQKTRQTSRQTVSRFGFLGHSIPKLCAPTTCDEC